MATGFSLKYGFSVCGVCGGHGGGAVHAMEPTTPLPVSCMCCSLYFIIRRFTVPTQHSHTILYMRMCSVGLGAAAVRSLVQVGAIVASLPNPSFVLAIGAAAP